MRQAEVTQHDLRSAVDLRVAAAAALVGARTVVARLSTPHRVRTIYLLGHADTRGPAEYNVALGQKRAVAVRAALIAAIERLRPGLSRSIRVVTDSLGETQPIAPSTTDDGRARNRRVEVILARV